MSNDAVTRQIYAQLAAHLAWHERHDAAVMVHPPWWAFWRKAYIAYILPPVAEETARIVKPSREEKASTMQDDQNMIDLLHARVLRLIQASRPDIKLMVQYNVNLDSLCGKMLRESSLHKGRLYWVAVTFPVGEMAHLNDTDVMERYILPELAMIDMLYNEEAGVVHHD